MRHLAALHHSPILAVRQTWEEAAAILGGLLASERARGLEVTIFNPRLDSDGSIAGHLCDLIADSVPR